MSEVFSSKSSVEGDVRDLFVLANQIQSKLEFLTNRLHLFRSLQVFMAIVGAASFVAVWGQLGGDDRFFGYSLLLITVLSGVCALLLELGIIKSILKKITHEGRALDAVLSVLRETSVFITDNKDISPLERANFRIQLSRFGI